MKKLCNYLVLAFVIVFCYNSFAQTNFYYYENNRIDLELSPGNFLVKFADGTTSSQQINTLSPLSASTPIIKRASFLPQYSFTHINSTSNYSTQIQQLNQTGQIEKAFPVFKANGKDDEFIFITDEIWIKWNPQYSVNYLAMYSSYLGYEVVKENEFTSGVYKLKVKNGSSENALELANRLRAYTFFFQFVEPEFHYFMDMTSSIPSNDPLRSKQWYNENTGTNTSAWGGVVDADSDIKEAWQYSTGEGARVAVLDDGVQLNHPDLVNNLLPGFDATGEGTNGAPTINQIKCNGNVCTTLPVTDAHGTNCAGRIAATANNNLGIIGNAYNTKIIPVRIFRREVFWNSQESKYELSYYTSNTMIANAINWSISPTGGNADVLSCSWGGGLPNSLITNAFNNAVVNGRNGLGSLVFVATGNDNGVVSYPATLNNVIAVGAMSMCNERKNLSSCDGEPWGSNFGNEIDVIAPGVKMTTTDITGVHGYSTNDYYELYNGTSSATPHTAAIAALLVSANPCKTGIQLRNALETTCQKVGSYSYTNNSGHSNGLWNQEMGYGLVNAKLALESLFPLGASYTNPIYGRSLNCGFSETQTINIVDGQCFGNDQNSVFIKLYGVPDWGYKTFIDICGSSVSYSGFRLLTTSGSGIGSWGDNYNTDYFSNCSLATYGAHHIAGITNGEIIVEIYGVQGSGQLKLTTSTDKPCGPADWDREGIELTGSDGISVYPTLIEDITNIKVSDNQLPALISISNMKGLTVKSEETSLGLTKINMNEYESGVYIVQVRTPTDTFMRKIVVK